MPNSAVGKKVRYGTEGGSLRARRKGDEGDDANVIWKQQISQELIISYDTRPIKKYRKARCVRRVIVA